MTSARSLSVTARAMIWVGSVLGVWFAGVSVLAVASSEFMDCSNPEIHESANTPLGWLIAVVTSVLPVLVAVRLTSWRHRLVWFALAVAVIEFGGWVWLINPGGCEWQ